MINWKPQTVRLKDLKPAEYNPRKTNRKAKKAFMRNVERMGDAEPIVVNKDLEIIGGHQRYFIFMERGIGEVEVFSPDRQLTPEEAKELNVKLNSIDGNTNAEKLMLLGLSQEVLDEIGFRDFKLPEITRPDKPVVEAHKKKNEKVHAFFFTVEELMIVKRVIKKIRKEQELDSVAKAVMYLLENYE